MARQFEMTVYRPRLERITIKVTAASEYEASNKAFERAAARADDKWDLLPKTTDFYCGHTGWNNDMFITEDGSLIPGSDQPGFREDDD